MRPLLMSLATAGLLAACGYGYEARSTTITGAPMITSGPQAGEPELSRTFADTSQRVALEVCAHERRCGRESDAPSCMHATIGKARSELTSWACDPASIRARLEECLAGLDETPCDVQLTSRPRLCPSNAACGERQADLVPPGRELAEIWR